MPEAAPREAPIKLRKMFTASGRLARDSEARPCTTTRMTTSGRRGKLIAPAISERGIPCKFVISKKSSASDLAALLIFLGPAYSFANSCNPPRKQICSCPQVPYQDFLLPAGAQSAASVASNKSKPSTTASPRRHAKSIFLMPLHRKLQGPGPSLELLDPLTSVQGLQRTRSDIRLALAWQAAEDANCIVLGQEGKTENNLPCIAFFGTRG